MMEAVIFDIDGTLIDSVDLHAQAWKETFAHFGKQVTLEDVRSQIGKGGDQLLPVFLSPDQIEQQGKDIEKFRGDLFKQKYLSQVRPLPCVRELFERILSDGKRIAIASSAKADELETYKKLAQVDDLVEAESTSEDAAHSKPHPDIFLAAIERLGSPARDRIVVVGDAPYDAEAAGKASVAAVGVLCGGFPEDVLRSAGCIAIYKNPADLLHSYQDSPLCK